MAKFHLVLLIHAHQPAGNFDDVLERAYAQCYRPFLDVLEGHAAVRAGLHYSGTLLEWLERDHPEYFAKLRALVERGQVELVGGGFYEPILISIPFDDRLEQIRRLADYLEKHFSRRPQGAWLAERVWEASLPLTLAAAGVDYTLVDDNPFLAAGFEPQQLYGSYWAEDLGSKVKVIPGLKSLRYLIPYRNPEEVIDFLRAAASEHPGGMAAMGDDLEKFGMWPGTNQHCYGDGWLERFFSALEANADWLAATPPGEYVAAHAPLGRADLPTASYTEMSEWALPTPARQRFQALQQEFAGRPGVLPFLRGGPWRNFLTKYAEANLLQKKMLHVSAKIRRLKAGRRRGEASRRALEKAETELLRAQCNDTYWHGIFGGLYAPHLRTLSWRSLILAESLADGIVHRRKNYAEASRLDFDADGSEEIYVTSERFAALFLPGDGGTLAALDYRPAAVALINSIMRRPEAYHARLKSLSTARPQEAVSIHDQARVKEAGLERWLQYDSWRRHSFRILLFGDLKSFEDYQQLRLDEDARLAGGAFEVAEATASQVTLVSSEAQDSGTPVGDGAWCAEKKFSLSRTVEGFEIACDVSLSRRGAQTIRANLGLEVIVNFLAPSRPDRYFDAGGQRYPLRWTAAAPASELRVVDEWQKVFVTLEAPQAREFWIVPIETVSESEDGFERVYQGSQILAVWPVELSAGGVWKARLVMKVAPVE